MTVDTETSGDTATLPTVAASGDPAAWTAEHRTELEELRLRHGAVHLTGTNVRTPQDVIAIREALGHPPTEAVDRFAPRTDHGHGAYSWPEWAPDRGMCCHHEQSHGTTTPSVLVLGALELPAEGGAIFIADTRRVLRELPEPTAARFRTRGWRLWRTYRAFLGLAWTEAFSTTDRDGLEKVLQREAIGYEWVGQDLRTRVQRPAVQQHPKTGEDCWFNDVAFFSQWSVPQVELDVMLQAFGPLGAPTNTAFGDGKLLPQDIYDQISQAYAAATVHVPWHRGDVLLVDNMLAAHGREPYNGDFDVVVALGGTAH